MQLEAGVPDGPKVQAWRGKTVQGSHPIKIKLVGLRNEVFVGGIQLWKPLEKYSGLAHIVENGRKVPSEALYDGIQGNCRENLQRYSTESSRGARAMQLAILGKIGVLICCECQSTSWTYFM